MKKKAKEEFGATRASVTKEMAKPSRPDACKDPSRQKIVIFSEAMCNILRNGWDQ